MRAAFVLEQQVGHQTFSDNLRQFLAADPQLGATWIPVTYTGERGWWDYLPGLPERWRGALTGRAQVRRGLRRANYEVAFFNTQVAAAIGGRVAQRRPYVLCTDITPRQYDQMGALYGQSPERHAWWAAYKHQVNRGLFRQAARVIGWSTWTKTSLLADYAVPEERVEVLPPGVDLERWSPGPPRPGRRLRVLFIGGDFERKGGADLLRAHQALPPDQAELVLVTRSPLAPAAGVAVHPHLHPNSPELVALAQSCDVFVLPTHAEAFGIAAVEASAVGLPAIVSRVGGLTDIVSDGETGYLIQPGDWQTLAQHLQRLAEDEALRRQLGQAARRRAETYFDARRNAARVSEIVRSAAAGDPGRPRRSQPAR